MKGGYHMEIFKHRNLALACFGFLVSLLLSFSLSNILLIFIAIFVFSLIPISITLFYVFRKRLIKDLIIKYTPLCLFVSLALLLSLLTFKKDMNLSLGYCDGEEKEVYLKITDESYTQDDFGIYLADIESINGQGVSLKALVYTYDKELCRGDFVFAKGAFSQLEEKSVGFSERDTYLEYGITLSFDCTEYKFLSSFPNSFLDFFEGLSSSLTKRLQNNVNSTTSPVLSSLFLGNRDMLSDSIKRDFSRIGISHILSLSGMHLAILVGALELILSRLRLSRLSNYLLLSLSVLFYIALTGFALSCLRAGLMVLAVYTCELILSRLNRLTSLFISVTLICAISPYSIFSSSLQLSFLAMLGCFVASKYIFRGRLRRTHGRGKRYVIFTFITSLFVTFFTLPIVSSGFGAVSLLSPISNIILVPLFSLLIYLAPIILLICDIPFLSDAIIFLTEKLTDLSLFLVRWLSSFEKSTLPIKNGIQVFGVIVIFASMILLLFLARKHVKKLVIASLFGAFIVFIGSSYLFIERGNNRFAGIYSYTNNDLVFYEENNTLSIIDITKSTPTSASRARSLVSFLGYGEVENYIISSYSNDTLSYFKRLTGLIKIKYVYLPSPTSDSEISLLINLINIAKQEGISLRSLESEINILKSKINLDINNQERSIWKSVSLTLKSGNGHFTYLSSGSYELLSSVPSEYASKADVLILGSFGPTYQEKFYYPTPYLDYCVFLGKSIEYARTDFVLNTMPYTVLYEGEPIRFRLP